MNAVRQMLERMGQEIRNLRKILGAHEEKMSRAGMLVESHADILDRQFWAAVPETGKRMVLSSREAWCVPPRNVRHYVRNSLAAAKHSLRKRSCKITSPALRTRTRSRGARPPQA